MIEVGAKIPDVPVKIATEHGNEDTTTGDVFAGKRVVLVSVPGAFTPTCSSKHLPGFIERAAEIRAKGVDLIACVSVNDVHVMNAWGKALSGLGAVTFIADGNGEFARAMGLALDGRKFGMGERSQRYVAIVDKGVITDLVVEEPGKFEVTTAQAILPRIG